MKNFSLFLVLFTGLFISGYGQAWSHNSARETGEAAVETLEIDNPEEALYHYKKALQEHQLSGNLSGEVNALETIALIYTKQKSYSLARYYCRKALRTGAATFRAYYLLAQIAYEENRNSPEAQKFCSEGLLKFPGNSHLARFQGLLNQRGDAELFPNLPAGQRTGLQEARQSSLSSLEQEIVEEMNRARQNPSAYARHLEELKSYFDKDLLKLPGKIPVRTREGAKAVEEAIAFLKRARPLGKLKASEGMSRAAKDHVLDQGRSGKTGHTGQDGSKPYERMERYGSWEGLSGENIAYGDETARMIVMQLIIDDGVPNRGHRENIFNPEFRFAGVAVGFHPIYRTMCVINFAGQFIEKQETSER